jgi:hypothetical protein
MNEVYIGRRVVNREQSEPKNVIDNACSVKLIFRDPVLCCTVLYHLHRRLINEVSHERILKINGGNLFSVRV